METLRVGALLHTHCFGGPCSALEGSPFDGIIFDVFGGAPKWSEELEDYASAQPGMEDPYQFSQQSPSCSRVALSIWPLLAGTVLVG